jgi:glyoxylate reductase
MITMPNVKALCIRGRLSVRKPRVLVGIQLHSEAMQQLQAVAEVDVQDLTRLQDKTYLQSIIGAYDGIIVAPIPLDREVLQYALSLKVISRRGVGYDTVDIQTATEQGIYVTVTPVLSGTVADLAFALLLATARHVPQAHQLISKQCWLKRQDRDQYIGSDVFGKTLGIIGLGRIGSEMVKRARGFEMPLLYYDLIRNYTHEEEYQIQFQPLHRVLAEADFISIHVPLTPRTRGLIGEPELKMMKRTAIIINTARGAIIDEKALYTALHEKWIAGAGLDVFEDEPIHPDNPLLALNNVVLTPHLAGATLECRRRTATVAVENVIHVLQGTRPRYSINELNSNTGD